MSSKKTLAKPCEVDSDLWQTAVEIVRGGWYYPSDRPIHDNIYPIAFNEDETVVVVGLLDATERQLVFKVLERLAVEGLVRDQILEEIEALRQISILAKAENTGVVQ
jgi:hypothetical protein